MSTGVPPAGSTAADWSLVSAVLPDPLAPLPQRCWPAVPAQVADWAARMPEAPAVTQQGQVWSYRELAHAAARITQVLSDAGLGPGQVVAVSAERGFALVAAWVAVLARRAVLLPVDPLLPTARQQQVLRRVGASSVVALGQVQVPPGTPVIRISALDATRPVPALDASSPPPQPTDPGYVVFTSGSTGAPKAIVGRHRSLAHFLHWQRTTFAIGPGDRVAHAACVEFDVALREVFLPVTSGALLCLPPPGPLTPGKAVAWLARDHVTVAHAVPTVARAWLRAAPAGVRLPDLRVMLFNGEPLPGALVQGWREQLDCRAQVVNLYGPSETTLARCWYRVPNPAPPGIQPLGRPIADSQLWVEDPEGRLAGIGEIGQVVIRTGYGTSGYLGAEPDEVARFTYPPDRPGDVVYRTGDLGRIDEQGLLHYQGRLDDQVKIYGVRVHPCAVEAVLQAQPGIEQAAVVAEPGRAGGPPRLAAYLVLGPDQPEIPSGLRGALRDHLPPAAIPARFTAVAALPTTPVSGKLDHRLRRGGKTDHEAPPPGQPGGAR